MNQVSIGNDIVDLGRRGLDRHARFIERICTPYEKEQIKEQITNMWEHWAAKEAAYKAVKRINSSIIFSPVTFEYHKADKAIIFEKISLPCKTVISEKFVYVVCATTREILDQALLATWVDEIGVQENPSIGASEAVRTMSVKHIAEFLKVDPQQLSISPSQVRSIPLLYLNAVQTNNLLSFSHHGRFILSSFLACDTK